MTLTWPPVLRTPDRVIPAAILAVAGVLWLAFRLYTGMILEDALITFRYAENLAAGNGFAFNPGEPVLGTTTPLLTGLLAAVAWLFGPAAIPAAAFAISCAAGLAAGACLWWLLRHWQVSRSLAALALCTWALHPSTLWTIAGGMETPLVVLFMLAGTVAAARGQAVRAGVACALLVLTRVDGLVFAGLLALLLLWRDPRTALRGGAVAVVLVLPWLAYAMLTFGSPVPHSVLAKAVIGQQRDPYSLTDPRALSSWLDWAASYWAAILLLWRPAGLALAALGAGWVAARRDLRESPALVVVAASALVPLFFYLAHAPRFEWYLVPVVWTSIVLGAFGLQVLADALTRRWDFAVQGTGWMLATVVATGLAWHGIGTAWTGRLLQENEDAARRAVGEWLRKHTAPDSSVAMEAIGYQGTHARRRIIDLAGLVSPEVVAIARRDSDNATRFHHILSELEPDALVLRSYEVDENRHFHGGPLFATAEQEFLFHARYAESVRFEAPHPELWGSMSRLTIYARRGSGVETWRFDD